MVAFFGGWFLMPPLMRLVSGGGPVVGSLVGLVFVLAFFAVFWLRTRYQRRKGGLEDPERP